MPKYIHRNRRGPPFSARIGELICQPPKIGHVQIVSSLNHSSDSSARSHEKVPTKAVHMPKFQREEMASRAKAVVLILWYALARSVALLTHA